VLRRNHVIHNFIHGFGKKSPFVLHKNGEVGQIWKRKGNMKFLVYDTGLSIEHALRLKQDGNDVLYFTPWATAFPEFKDYALGLGVLEKTKYFFDHIDEADCIVFFDIGAGDLAHFLRQRVTLCLGLD